MNPRIKQLAYAAKLEEHMLWTSNEGNVLPNEMIKFAELIIADIVKIVEPDQYHQAYPDNVIGSYGGLELLQQRVAKIKKLFDV